MLQANGDVGLLVAQQGNLGGDDVEVAVDAQSVAFDGEFQVALRGFDGDFLLRVFGVQNSQGGDVVFHLLEGRQDGLPVGGGVGAIAGPGLLGNGVAFASVKHNFRRRDARRPIKT